MKPESSLKKSPRLIVKTDKKEKKEWIEAKVASKAGNRNFSCSIVSESDVFNQHTRTYMTPKNKIKKAKRLTLVFGWSVFSLLFRFIQWHFFDEQFHRCFKTLIWIGKLHLHACSFVFKLRYPTTLKNFFVPKTLFFTTINFLGKFVIFFMFFFCYCFFSAHERNKFTNLPQKHFWSWKIGFVTLWKKFSNVVGCRTCDEQPKSP